MKFALLILIAIGVGLILYAPQEYRLTVLILNMTVLGGIWLYRKYQ